MKAQKSSTKQLESSIWNDKMSLVDFRKSIPKSLKEFPSSLTDLDEFHKFLQKFQKDLRECVHIYNMFVDDDEYIEPESYDIEDQYDIYHEEEKITIEVNKEQKLMLEKLLTLLNRYKRCYLEKQHAEMKKASVPKLDAKVIKILKNENENVESFLRSYPNLATDYTYEDRLNWLYILDFNESYYTRQKLESIDVPEEMSKEILERHIENCLPAKKIVYCAMRRKVLELAESEDIQTEFRSDQIVEHLKDTSMSYDDFVQYLPSDITGFDESIRDEDTFQIFIENVSLSEELKEITPEVREKILDEDVDLDTLGLDEIQKNSAMKLRAVSVCYRECQLKTKNKDSWLKKNKISRNVYEKLTNRRLDTNQFLEKHSNLAESFGYNDFKNWSGILQAEEEKKSVVKIIEKIEKKNLLQSKEIQENIHSPEAIKLVALAAHKSFLEEESLMKSDRIIENSFKDTNRGNGEELSEKLCDQGSKVISDNSVKSSSGQSFRSVFSTNKNSEQDNDDTGGPGKDFEISVGTYGKLSIPKEHKMKDPNEIVKSCKEANIFYNHIRDPQVTMDKFRIILKNKIDIFCMSLVEAEADKFMEVFKADLKDYYNVFKISSEEVDINSKSFRVKSKYSVKVNESMQNLNVKNEQKLYIAKMLELVHAYERFYFAKYQRELRKSYILDPCLKDETFSTDDFVKTNANMTERWIGYVDESKNEDPHYGDFYIWMVMLCNYSEFRYFRRLLNEMQLGRFEKYDQVVKQVNGFNTILKIICLAAQTFVNHALYEYLQHCEVDKPNELANAWPNLKRYGTFVSERILHKHFSDDQSKKSIAKLKIWLN